MNTTQAKAKTPARKAAPAQRKTTTGRTPEEVHAQAWKAFLDRAQRWLLKRPDRVVMLPDELTSVVVACGVPCGGCGRTVHQVREPGHTVWWRRVEGGHWAGGITVDCRVPKA